MELIFPTVIHQIEVKKFKSIKNELIKFVYDQQEKDSTGVTFSNLGGWQSQPVYNRDDNIMMKTISDNLLFYFRQNVLQMDNEITIESLWININKKGDQNVLHDHPLSHMAGVFWIKTPKDCGHLEFENPHHFICAHEIQRYTDDFKSLTNSYPAYFFTPTEGNITLFPSSLSHRVEVNESDDDRISASFNLTFKT